MNQPKLIESQLDLCHAVIDEICAANLGLRSSSRVKLSVSSI